MSNGRYIAIDSIPITLRSQNADVVQVAPYDSISTAAGNVGTSGSNGMEFVNFCYHYRIRQDGTLVRVRFYVPSITNVTNFWIKAWRPDNIQYRYMGVTEDLIADMVAGQICDKTLASPITGLREGDILGARIYASPSATGILTMKSVTGGIYSFVGRTDPGTLYDWESKTFTNAFGIPIEAYMQAPHIISIGDSRDSGSPLHRSHCEPITPAKQHMVFKPGQTMPWHFHLMTASGAVYQNMGIAGQTAGQIGLRLATDALAKKPRYCHTQRGVNDILGLVSQESFMGSATSFCVDCLAAGVVPIVESIVPAASFSTAQFQQMDVWNAALGPLVMAAGGMYVYANPYLCQFKVGGDAGNLWELQPPCSADGTHYSAYGQYQRARAIADAFRRHWR